MAVLQRVRNRHQRPAGRHRAAGLSLALTAGALIALASPAQADPLPVCTPVDTVVATTDQLMTFTDETACRWLVPAAVTSAEVLVVAGGGSAALTVGSGPGAGGAGGLIHRATGEVDGRMTLTPGSYVTVQAGRGGQGQDDDDNGRNGTASVFGALSATGGGAGAAYMRGHGFNGGSGGGASQTTSQPGYATPAGQGHNGAAAVSNLLGGGGGGAGGAADGEDGGIGLSISITGGAVVYAEGGSARYLGCAARGCLRRAAGPGFTGADGGPVQGFGGWANGDGTPGNGGDGVVMVRYPLPITPPGTPGTPVAVAGDTQATVTITPPVGGSAPSSYTVRVATPPGNTSRTCTRALPALRANRSASVLVPAISCTVTGLTNGTAYTFEVQASNGEDSAWSAPSAPVTPVLSAPGVPGTPSAFPGNGQAVVSVVAPAGGGAVARYRVRAVGDAAKFCEVVSPGTSCTVLGLANRTGYQFEVQAINQVASSEWSAPSASVITFAPPSPPAPPAGVTAVAGTASLAVSWAPSTGATGYVATAQPGPATCTTTTATSCVLGASAGTAYTVTVVAHSEDGPSDASVPSAPVTPLEPETPPTVPAGTPNTLTTENGQIALTSPGQQLVIRGSGYAPHSTATVILYSTPVELGTVTTDAAGAFSLSVTVPAGLDPGSHTFLATGVDAAGVARLTALPVTVAPTNAGDDGTLPVPAGGTITLLDAAGTPTTSVLVPGQGTYSLDAGSGVISFVPVPGFVGTATAVTYRITDAVGTVITGTYTAVVADPAPPAGVAVLDLPARMVATTGRNAAVSVPCRLSRGAIDRCTISVTAVVSGRRVAVGRGVSTPKATTSAGKTIVKVALTGRGSGLSARPGGARLVFTATVVQRDRAGSSTATARTTVLAAGYALGRSIRFADGSAAVRASEATYLRGVRAKLDGARAITCVGHDDNSGSARSAVALGRRRATAVCTLLAKGRKVGVRIVSRGEKAPLRTNRTAAGRAANRRVAVTVQN